MGCLPRIQNGKGRCRRPLSYQASWQARGQQDDKSIGEKGNAIDLEELINGINEMGCINNGNMPLKQLAPLLYKIFGVESKDCYRFYIDIKRRKNESRTYFLNRMQEKLNERMLRDEEMERMRR